MYMSPTCCACFPFFLHEHDQMQKKTFTKWVNYHLETHSSSDLVEDLFEDLKDGVLLCHLIEVLTGEALPVNKTKESKRVHHISNLTTALAALRRRGLDLVNNNPTDIANGNPRIICGLIWQMILHFQIETNVQLLKEWGFELELANSPSTSKINNESGPFNKLPYQLRIGHLKAPVDRVILRWVNAQLARPYNINLTDMDKSWRDGIAFNALIHRVKPELIDMDIVRRNTPKANLEQAFRIAKEYLHIRPLLDVEDMLCDKSDKRSVITYVSQFIRTLKHLRPIATFPMIDEHSLVSWMENTLNILRSSIGASLYDQYEIYLSLRKEYFEHRNAYYSFRERINTLPEGEWNQIDTSWKRIGVLLEDWSHRLEGELPGKLSELVQWLCTAEQIIQNPVEKRLDDAQLSLSNINESISHHKMYFSEFPYRSEQFQSIYLNRRIDEREVAIELLEPLKIRFNTLAISAPRRLQYLYCVQAHYQLLSDAKALIQKMERWKSSDSATAIQKSVKEYKMEADSAPMKKFKRLLTRIKELYSEASLEEVDCVMKQCESTSLETAKKFQQLKPHLEELSKLWREFENTVTKIEEIITRSEREKRNLINGDELLQHCEKIRDDIVRLANDQVQHVINNRLYELRRRISTINRKIPTKTTSLLQGNVLLEKRTKITLPSGENVAVSTLDLQDVKHSRLQKWLIMARQQMSTVVTDLNTLEQAINQVAHCLREVQEVENERMALLKTRAPSSEQSISEYRKLRSDLQALLQHMKNVQPLFLSFDKNCNNLLNWLSNQSTENESEENEKSDMISHMTFLLETLSRNEYKKWINCEYLQHRLDELKHRMKERKEQLAQMTKSFGTATGAAALTKKKKLLEQSVESWEDIKIWTNNVTEIDTHLEIICSAANSTSILISDEFKNEKERLEKECHQKKEAISKLKMIHDAIEVLRNKLVKNPRLSELMLLNTEIDHLSQQCMDIVDPNVTSLRNCCQKEIEEELRTAIAESFARAEQQITELLMVGETDVPLAVDILQNYEQEAQEIPSDESKLSDFLIAVKEAQKILQEKMDLFTGLQHFYEALNAIKQENEQWNSITSHQIEDVCIRLEELLKLIENERAPEANALCSQFESIQSSFFQLECDRIKEKLRFLVLQLDKLVDFMAKRKILLLKCKEFQKFVKDAEDTLLRTMHEASVGVKIDMYRITNEMCAVFDKLDKLGKELTACQLDANMTISDISVVDALNRIKNIPLGGGSTEESIWLSNRFQEFFDVSNQLENAFFTDIHSCEHLDDVVDFITVSLENGKKETELMVQLVAIADDLTAHEKTKANDILSKLKRIMDKRQEVRRATVEDCMERSLVILAQKEDQLETIIERDMNDQNLDAFKIDEVMKWIPWKKELDQLTTLMKDSNIQWRGLLDELVKKAASFDERIIYFKNRVAKSKRREQRISAKLAAFAKWIDLMEEDLNQAQSLGTVIEQAEKLRSIHNMCLSHQTLVDKFLNSKPNPVHSSEIKIQCDRYYALLHRSDLRNFSEKEGALTNLSNLRSSSMLSQLSISSLSTSGTDEDEICYVDHAELASHEGTSSAYALTQRVLQAKGTPEIQPILSDIDSELNLLANSLSTLNADYARSLKPLSSAQADIKKIIDLNERRCHLDIACDNLLRNVSGDDLAVVRSLALHLHSLEEPFMTFLRELQREVDDEIALQANYENITKQLNQLNTDIDQRARDVIHDVRNQLEYVQSDLNLLRMQCSQQRKYVENMLESLSPDATLGNCSKRKKIMLMVSRTVTTIIQVVEDELLRPSTIKENDLLELKQKLQDVNICITDETDAVDEVVPGNIVHEQELEKLESKNQQMKMEQIDEQINAFESALNETIDEILPPMNELISRSHLGNINLPSLHSELENTQKFAEKCKKKLDDKLAEKEQITIIQLELAKLEEKLSLGNQLLTYDIDLKNVDNEEDIGEKVKNIENLEQFLSSTLDKLKDFDRSIITNEQHIDMEKMLNEAISLTDKLHVLRDSIANHLKSLNDWKIAKNELEDQIRIIMDNIEKLFISYSQPQSYMTAINDIDMLKRLQDQIMQMLQKIIDEEQIIRQNLPIYLPAIDTIRQKIEKAAEDVEKLLSSLTDDISTEKQLLNIQNDLINRLNKLSDNAIMIRNVQCDEIEIPRLEELKNELEEISNTLEQLKEKENKPMKLVLHSDALKISSIIDQYENLNKLLNETQEQIINEFAHMKLQSTINNESQQLYYMMDEAYKVENDINMTTSDLQKAIDDLKNGRSHLLVLQDAYDKLEGIPNTDSLREKIINEISTLNEKYDNIERNLEDRFDMLNKFDEIAGKINEQLIDLENNVRKLECPNASCELAIANKGFNDVNELRKSLEKLYELKEQLIPLLKPISVVEDFDNRLSDVNKNFQQWHDEIVKKKQELEAENNLSSLINDFEQTVINAENDFEKLEITTSTLKNFRDIILPMIIEKSDRIRDLLLPVKTENIEQLYHNVDALTNRYNNLSTRVNDKLNHAKEQENLFDNIQQELDCMEQKADDFINKYIISQDLSIAMEDVNHLRSLLDQIPISAMENIREDKFKENLVKKADSVKMKIKNLLIPLEKDIRKEQELMNDINEILSTLTSIGDDVITIDPNIEPLQQLENIAQLAENLRKLKGKVEKLEERLQNSEGMVKRSLVTDDLFGRIVELQNALDDKKEKLTDRAKLYAIIPEINLINESMQNYINEMEQISMLTVEKQNDILNELEGKKHHLENLLENIPPGYEGNELREKNNWLLGQVNDILKRLAAVVEEKFAALTTFNANKDEVEIQLSLLQAIPISISDENTIVELNNRLHDINDKFANLEKLKNKIDDADERNLDVEKITEKHNLLHTIEEALDRLKNYREIIEKQIINLRAAEKIYEDGNHLCNELNALIKKGKEVLNDAEAIPTIYTTILDAFVSPLEMATELLNIMPENEEVAIRLKAIVKDAKILEANLSNHANLWSQFVNERDNATDQLEKKRKPLDEIGNKQIRSCEQVVDDLDKLKKAAEELNDLRDLMIKLQSLSEQLDPLETAYADVRFYDVDVEQTQQQYENLISLMNSELHDENILNESAQQLAQELEYINDKLLIEPIVREQLEEILNYQLPPFQAHLQFLQTKDDEAKRTRTHVDRISQPSIETLTKQLNDICLLLNQQLDNLTKAENQEKAMIMKMELEKLRTEPYNEEILMKLEEQLQQLPIEDENMQILAAEMQKLRVNKVEHDSLEKEIEIKLAELLNRMNVIRTNLTPIMEEEESEEKQMKDKQTLPEIDEQINAFESALNETIDEILPPMNELISRSHLGNINLPSLHSELENTQKFAEKCKKKLDDKLAEKEQITIIQLELAKLEEKLSLGNQLLTYDIDLKNVDNEEDIGEKVKNIENLEQFLSSTLDKLKDFDRSIITNEQHIDMEKMLNEAISLTDKLHVLRDSIANHLKSLNDWKIAKNELEDQIRIIMDNIEKLFISYSQPQSYMTAINDIDMLKRLQDQIMQMLQKIIDEEQIIRQNLPIYLPAIDTIRQKIEKAAEDVEKLLSSLTDDISTEKQLLNIQNDLINRLNKLSDNAIMIRNVQCDEIEIPRLEELKNELEEISNTLEQLKEKENKPMKLVLHSDALKISSIIDQYENLNKLLNETQEQIINEFAHMKLQSTINNESQQLYYMMDEAYKVENDINMTTSDLQKAIDDLKNGRSHLLVLQDAYDKLEGIPNTDSLREKIINEISTLNEKYDNIERNLEDRFDMLNKFDEIAGKINEQLIDLENNVRKLECPNASCELAIANKGFNDVNELRKSLEKLYELKEQLIPLLKPISVVEDFDNRLSDVNKNFQQWHDEIVKKKQELEAENNLSSLINDFEQTVINAENDFEKLEITTSTLKNFRDIILPMIIEKSDRIRDLLLPVKTENIEQLYHNVDALTNRYNNLSTRVNDKLNHAKEQENLFDNIQQELDCMEQKADDFINKYIISQDLSIAMEDVNHLRSLLDQIPISAMENIREDKFKENLVKKADSVKMKIKNLLIPLEKDIRKEQELMNDINEILSTLTSIGDDVITIDPNIEPLQQLENIAQLAENLRKLKGKVEKLEERLQNSEGMVKRSLVTDDLFGRIVELQNALDDKKEKLTDRAKLYAIIPEINLINESMQNYINEMEQISMLTVEKQNDILNELEGKKHHLENLLENIPPGYEGNELREKNNWLLGQVNDILKRLAAVVEEKFAALTTFNANKDEVEIQLSLLQAIPISISDENTIVELNNRLHDINDKFANLEKLKNKIDDADERNLDVEKITEKHNLLHTIEEALDRLKNYREIIEKQIINLRAAEKIYEDGNHLCNELNALIKKGKEVLNDAEAIPTIYTTILDAFVSPLEMATELLNIMPENEEVAIRLKAIVKDAKILEANLSNHANLWSQFVNERDNATDQLEKKRKPLDEIGNKQIRSCEQVVDDLDKLKKTAEELNDLRDLMIKLQSLSEQLDPLETAYADVRFYDVDVEQTQQQYENLISLMNSELHDENILNESAQQLAQELEYINDKLLIEPIVREQLEEILNYQLPPFQAHLQFLQTKDDEAKRTRTHVDRISQPSIETLTKQLNDICLLLNQQLDNLTKAENQEKAMIMKMELEKLRTEPYNEEILMKLEEQLQQLPIEDENMQILAAEMQKLRVNKVEHDSLEKEIEIKLAELLNRMNVIRTNLTPIMEEEESEEKQMKDKQTLPEIDEQINAFESALNETIDEILPPMNELISRSHLGNINLPSLHSELENTQKFAEKCKKKLDDKLAEKEQITIIQLELAKLEEKLSLGNQLLTYDIDLKNVDNEEDIGEKVKNIENLEQFLSSTLDKLKDFDRSIITNEQHIDMEKMLNEAISLTDKLHVLRDSIANHLKSLNDWKIAKNELEDQIRIIMDNIEKLFISYSQPQSYMTAINDIDMLKRLQDQIMQMLQKIIDEEQIIRQNLPIYLPAIDTIRQKIEKAAEDVEKLLSSLTDDISTEKQLLNIQNDLINRLNKLSDNAIMIRNVQCDEIEIPRLEELKNELEEISNTLEQLKEKENKPMKLVLHSDALKISSIIDQYENLNKLLNETQEQIINEFAHMKLQSTINNESQQLYYMMDEAYKVENDINMTTSDLQKAIDDLKNGRSHLLVLQDAYDKLEGIPNTDSLREKIINEISTLNEKYDNIERNLEDRFDMLNKFDEIAGKINEQLIDLENNVRKLECPNASCELAIANKGFNDVNELRKSLEKLYELKEQLIPLLKPISVVEDFDNRLSDVNKNFQQWHDEIVKKKQELEAENNLSSLINDFEQTVINAENDFEKLEITTSTLKNFRDIILPMIIEKSDRIRDLLLPVKTENIEQLYHNVDALTNRYNNLSTRVNDKLNHAKEQENLFDNIQQELDCMEQKADDFINKYIISQDLSIAMEDVNHLRSLLDQIPISAMENIREDKFKENLVKKADSVKMKIKNLLIPLEKDIRKEQELMNDINEILSTLTSIGDDVITIDPNIEPLQQLENIAQLAENLRKLKGKVEKLEERLQNSEGMVKRSLVTDDLFGRIVELQNALDDKKEKLTDRAKLYAIIPEINLINESMQNYINEMEQISMLTVEKQNDILNELEGKKHHLENLLENIPPGYEGNELREKNNWLLGQVNDILKRLAAVVEEKFAALTTFNANKDEVEIQLSLLQAIPISISDENTIVELNNRLHDINDKFANLEKLKNKIDDADERNLDVEKITEKHNLLHTIEEALDRLKKDHECLDERLTLETICTDCTVLYNELEILVKDARKLLDDSEAHPIAYSSTSDQLTTLIETGITLRTNNLQIEQASRPIFGHLWKLIDKAKDVQAELIRRVYVWEQYVNERDSLVEELNDIRRQICEIEERGKRQFDKMIDDLEVLKMLYLRWSFHANLPSRLLSLSSQLRPLACAQREEKAFAEETNEIERKIENLLGSMSAEFRMREEILHSLLVTSDELDDINKAFDDQKISVRLQKELRQQLESIRAHLKTSNEDITKYNDNRMFLIEEKDIATKRNFEKLQEIEEKLKLVELMDNEEKYDIDAAAEVLAAVYPDNHPRDVLRKQGIPYDDNLHDLSATSDDDDDNKFKTPPDDQILQESEGENTEAEPLSSVALSPVPDDPSPGYVHYERQRTRWRRILRAALPLQAMLVLLLGAACLVPHCDDESCCQLLNNFARSFDPSLEFLNGPPPF
ncbi:Nuclear anchorage protein [Dirofilaria immitis]